jgi:ribosomal protein L29
MCTAVQLMGTVMNPGNFNEKKLRVMECADLNNQLYEMGKEIIDKEVQATVEFVAVQTHEFHPDSEFVLFKVKYT